MKVCVRNLPPDLTRQQAKEMLGRDDFILHPGYKPPSSWSAEPIRPAMITFCTDTLTPMEGTGSQDLLCYSSSYQGTLAGIL